MTTTTRSGSNAVRRRIADAAHLDLVTLASSGIAPRGRAITVSAFAACRYRRPAVLPPAPRIVSMSSGADLFVVCKTCGSEVSAFVTECPYCGTRLRKRAPKLDRAGAPQRRPRRPALPRLRRDRPRLGRLRPDEMP